MKEPTYSVFVRFRRGQRLTLRRFMPLEAAIRFAAQVRSERFHDPDAVFIVDDSSGETVVEGAAAATGITETCVEAPPMSAVHSSPPESEDDLEALLQHVDRWQIRHAQSTLRNGQRLAATVERSLGQLARQMEHLSRVKLFGSDLPKVLQELTLAAEQMSSVREGLHALSARLSGVAEVPDEGEAAASKAAQPSKRKEAHGKR